MRRKSPWIAGILNFFFPGLGFAYLGGTTYLVAGIGLFALVLIDVAQTWQAPLRPGEVVGGVLTSFALAGLAAETALLRNRWGASRPLPGFDSAPSVELRWPPM